jgi:hypothetical protein
MTGQCPFCPITQLLDCLNNSSDSAVVVSLVLQSLENFDVRFKFPIGDVSLNWILNVDRSNKRLIITIKVIANWYR